MESQPQNPEFRNNPENFHPCLQHWKVKHILYLLGRTHSILTLCMLGNFSWFLSSADFFQR